MRVGANPESCNDRLVYSRKLRPEERESTCNLWRCMTTPGTSPQPQGATRGMQYSGGSGGTVPSRSLRDRCSGGRACPDRWGPRRGAGRPLVREEGPARPSSAACPASCSPLPPHYINRVTYITCTVSGTLRKPYHAHKPDGREPLLLGEAQEDSRNPPPAWRDSRNLTEPPSCLESLTEPYG